MNKFFKELNKKTAAVVLAAAFIVFAGVYIGQNARAAAPSQGSAMPPMPVTVVTAQESTQPIWSEYPGRLDPVDSVQIQPQVGGAIKEIKFDEGQIVKKGDVLFVIDPAPYEAAVAQAEADLNGAKSQYDYAQKQLVRAQDLLKTDAISKTLLDQDQSNADVAKNAIQSDEAKLQQAKINLDYAYIKAPISGRVGRAEITAGNIVATAPAAPPVLTTIVSNDEIYADFDVDEQTYLQNIRAGGAQGVDAERAIPVKLTVKGDESVVYDGKIQSFDNQINAASGTIRARALFKNADGALLPGMFVTVKLGRAGDGKNLLIPEEAVGTDQDRKFVYVVDESNKVVYREVKLGTAVEGQIVVADGLKPGEKIITKEVMRVRPDMIVAPHEDQQQAQAAPDAAPQTAPAADAGKPGEAKPDDSVLKKVDTDKKE